MQKESKRERTRNHILSCAWTLFEECSYTATTTRQISERAGVANGTVFSHFPTKYDLLTAGIQERVACVLKEASASDTQSEPSERLVHYARYLYRYYLDNREFSIEIFRELIWQPERIEAQIVEFQERLYSKQPEFDGLKSSVLMDLYFMVLIKGLNDSSSTADSMIKTLERKVALVA
ncbi:TetR family transcriptional regulator [Vibrio sp. vnigr-6D03]|nr:TetR family transcriptional regulator [Vibrio sp. vnigr-6D03]